MDPTIITACISALGPLSVAAFGAIVERNRKRDRADAAAWREQQRLQEDERRQEWNAIKQGMKGLLRNSIMEVHHECMARGSIITAERETLQGAYEAYKGLDGDGVVDDLYEEVTELPTIEGK